MSPGVPPAKPPTLRGRSRWLLELGSPPNIANRGWTSKSLKVGDVVTVTFNPGLRGTRVGKLVKVVLATGKELQA